MFGKLAADALGLSDIGSVIKQEDYNKVDSDDYVMHEDQEKIYFLIKSKKDEYCFTNTALIHLDGNSVDMDIEIKFVMGGTPYSIDVHKKHIEEVKDLYKTLFRISEITRDNEVSLEHAKVSLDHATQATGRNSSGAPTQSESFKEIAQAANSWLTSAQQKYVQKDFAAVFDERKKCPEDALK
jgi:Bacterial PH domain/YvbH-like oligomerisation region